MQTLQKINKINKKSKRYGCHVYFFLIETPRFLCLQLVRHREENKYDIHISYSFYYNKVEHNKQYMYYFMPKMSLTKPLRNLGTFFTTTFIYFTLLY